jgi:hypothetical protein
VDRLHDHDTVVVTLPRGQYLVPIALAARILAIDGMTVALELENREEAGRIVESVAPEALMTFRHGDSLVGFRGTLYAARPAGDFRFVVADRLATRSRSTRINCMTRIRVRRLAHEGAGEEAQGVTINIAPAGLLIEAAGADAVTGDRIEFHMTHPDDRTRIVTGAATVVRHGDGLIAVAVAEESVDARAELGALVVSRSRAALHKDDEAAPEPPGF